MRLQRHLLDVLGVHSASLESPEEQEASLVAQPFEERKEPQQLCCAISRHSLQGYYS